MVKEYNPEESVVGIFSNLRAKYGGDESLKGKPILVDTNQKGWMSTYEISWGEIKIGGRSSLTQDELRVELKKEFRRVKDISILFRKDYVEMERRSAEEKRINREFWEEHFTEDGAYMSR